MQDYTLTVLSIVVIAFVGLLLMWRLTRATSAGVRVLLRSLAVALVVVASLWAFYLPLLIIGGPR
jgi:hypothetical protein